MNGEGQYQEPTMPFQLTVTELWLIHDALQPHFAGFSGRDPSAQPWHAESALRKVASAILAARDLGLLANDQTTIDLSADEATAISYHVPRTASRDAAELLIRLWRHREALEIGIPLLAADPTPQSARSRLAEWASVRKETEKGGEHDGGEGSADDAHDVAGDRGAGGASG